LVHKGIRIEEYTAFAKIFIRLLSESNLDFFQNGVEDWELDLSS